MNLLVLGGGCVTYPTQKLDSLVSAWCDSVNVFVRHRLLAGTRRAESLWEIGQAQRSRVATGYS